MNNYTTTNKKNIFYIVVLLLTLIVVIIGATFAIFTFLKSQKEGSSAVYTGTLSIEYTSGKIISIKRMFPINKPNYNETNNVYRNNFKVTNTGTLDSLIDINLNLKENQFSNDTLKYNLYNSDEEVIAEGFIYGKGKITLGTNIVIENSSEKEFVLMIWISENNENQNSEMRKSVEGIIEIEANQKLE